MSYKVSTPSFYAGQNSGPSANPEQLSIIDLLDCAKSTFNSLQTFREEQARVQSEPDEGEEWFVEKFGTRTERLASLDCDIAEKLTMLSSVRADLLAQGMTQERCRNLLTLLRTIDGAEAWALVDRVL